MDTYMNVSQNGVKYEKFFQGIKLVLVLPHLAPDMISDS